MIRPIHRTPGFATQKPHHVAMLFAGSWKPAGYFPLVGGRVSAMPRASLVLVSTSHTLLGVASRKRAPGLSNQETA